MWKAGSNGRSLGISTGFRVYRLQEIWEKLSYRFLSGAWKARTYRVEGFLRCRMKSKRQLQRFQGKSKK